MTYKYICPTENGYREFTMKWKVFGEIVPTRKGRRFTKLKGYVKDKHIILHYIPTVTGCILCTALYPFLLISEGVSNYKSIWDEVVTRMWYAEERGAFSGDDVYERNNGDDTFKKLLAAAEFE